MRDFPPACRFGKKIPKRKFCEGASPQVRRVFTEVVESVVWEYKLAPDTIGVAPGENIGEVEILRVVLKREAPIRLALDAMRKAIPYPLIFVIEYGDKRQLLAYYDGGWQKSDWATEHDLRLHGLDLDAVYENLIRQIGGIARKGGLSEDAAALARKRQLEKRIAQLLGKMRAEKQFKKRVEYNQLLRELKRELAELADG